MTVPAHLRDVQEDDDQWIASWTLPDQMAVRMDLAASAEHDLKAPMGRAMNMLNHLQNSLPSSTPGSDAQSRAVAQYLVELEKGLTVIQAGFFSMQTMQTNLFSLIGPVPAMARATYSLDRTFADLEEKTRHAAAEMNTKRAQAGDDRGFKLRIKKTSLKVYTDSNLLQNIILNLVENAIKHSGGNRVVVGARIKNGRAVIEVHDNGKGLPDYARAKLLSNDPQKNFNQLVSRRKKDGLGLYIVPMMAHYLKAEIRVPVTPNMKGTRIEVVLPDKVTREARETQTTQRDQILAGRRVVLLDNDELLLAQTKKIFADLGAEVLCFTDDIAMTKNRDLWRKSNDLFIMDYQLDERTVEKTINELYYRYSADVFRAVLLTGHANTRELHNLRIDFRVIQKPLGQQDIDLLIKMINHDPETPVYPSAAPR
jgi:two-component sensor histidine kinase